VYRAILTSFLLLAAVSGNVLADCSQRTQIVNQDRGGERNNLRQELRGKTICATKNGERWQEDHRAGGQLWDYKKGPRDKMDPSAQVGTWETNGFGADTKVIYNYGSAGGTFSYTVHKNGGDSYSFCGDGGEITGTLQNARQCP
jgi:hypothetical protein